VVSLPAWQLEDPADSKLAGKDDMRPPQKMFLKINVIKQVLRIRKFFRIRIQILLKI
jgi:hypothetical protein